MDIVLDEDLLQEEDPVVQKTGKKRRRRKSGTDPVVYKLQQQLAAELAKPLVSKGVLVAFWSRIAPPLTLLRRCVTQLHHSQHNHCCTV